MPPDPLSPLLGGALIGVAASLLLLLNGRVAGISGVVGELFTPRPGEVAWRVAFAAGLATGAVALLALMPHTLPSAPVAGTARVVVGGVLVGLGTRLGNGCTSGHGVCGLPRGARRSWVATAVFMAVGAAVATGLGGAR